MRKTLEQKQEELERLRGEAKKVVAELLNQMTRDQLKRYLKHKKLVFGRQSQDKSGTPATGIKETYEQPRNAVD